jgi:DNA invertase Pin-like site-specific DNA recombinase
MKKAAAYLRTSTRDGRQTTENQLAVIRDYARQNGLTIVREYSDAATGANGSRDGLHDLMQGALSRKFDTVLVFALDRFTREGVFRAFAYIEQLREAGVEFRSVTEPHFQTTGMCGELFLAVAAWIAKQEREQLRGRIKAGLDRARASGRTLGRPRRIVDCQKLIDLREQGRTIREIERLTGVSRATITRKLAQEATAQ